MLSNERPIASTTLTCDLTDSGESVPTTELMKNEDLPITAEELIQREEARLLKDAATKAAEAAEAAAKAEAYRRKVAEVFRLAAELNLSVTPQSFEQVSRELAGAAQAKTARGTLGTLIADYRSDPRSPYKNLRYKTREHYDVLLRRLENHSSIKLEEFNAPDIQRLYDGWTDGGTKKTPMGHALITMLRGLVNYGATVRADKRCETLAVLLHKMHFPVVKPRSEQLTAEHADAIIRKAHEVGRPSIALAQAFQFDLMMRQKDVIGEWVPLAEPGMTEVVHGGLKWLRGLRWEEIDSNLVLRHITSRGSDTIVRDLRNYKRVIDELRDRLPSLPKRGPMIVCEATGVPWTAQEFRRQWRILANQCGIPKAVKNMDSRKPNDEAEPEKKRPVGAGRQPAGR